MSARAPYGAMTGNTYSEANSPGSDLIARWIRLYIISAMMSRHAADTMSGVPCIRTLANAE